MQADFGCRVTPGGGVGRREAASRAPWEGWRPRDWERELMPGQKEAKSGWRGSGLMPHFVVPGRAGESVWNP